MNTCDECSLPTDNVPDEQGDVTCPQCELFFRVIVELYRIHLAPESLTDTVAT